MRSLEMIDGRFRIADNAVQRSRRRDAEPASDHSVSSDKGKIFCLDTEGGHLLSDAVARKLFDIKEDGKTRINVRFITEGKQSELRGKALKGGYTVWKMKSCAPAPIHVTSLEKAVEESLK